MRPEKALPISDEFSSEDDYVEALLRFASSSDVFRLLCGGIHILDFFTSEPGLFYEAIAPEWQAFLVGCETTALLDLLMRDELGEPVPSSGATAAPPPESLLRYIRDIRRLSLRRDFSATQQPPLDHKVAMGMKRKKEHEVAHFAGYVDGLASEVARRHDGREPTHLVDFGSGQNYLGRALASEPYGRHVVAVESRAANMEGARRLDLAAGVAEKQKVMRNKKIYMEILERLGPDALRNPNPAALRAAAIAAGFTADEIAAADLRPLKQLQLTYTPEQGRGSIRYVLGHLENADLNDVVAQLRPLTDGGNNDSNGDGAKQDDEARQDDLRLMAMSIHSCGNLSHYGIRSLVLNPHVRAVAIVGCCYNLLTEKLGPPADGQADGGAVSLRPVNRRVVRESERRDPQGFPMSEKLSSYGGHGIRLNVTARMMACQAPQNWDENSNSFFTRHFYRAVLQKILLDKGVISATCPASDGSSNIRRGNGGIPMGSGTSPVVIGSLRKSCYGSFRAYVRGAIAKLTTHADLSEYSAVVKERMGDMTDEEIDGYEERFRPRERELTSVWSLMAFSACVVESLIVADRWTFLKEHPDVVGDAWVDTVFDYRESPRNLVVVGIKK